MSRLNFNDSVFWFKRFCIFFVCAVDLFSVLFVGPSRTRIANRELAPTPPDHGTSVYMENFRQLCRRGGCEGSTGKSEEHPVPPQAQSAVLRPECTDHLRPDI